MLPPLMGRGTDLVEQSQPIHAGPTLQEHPIVTYPVDLHQFRCSIMGKLAVQCRLQAVARDRELGLV